MKKIFTTAVIILLNTMILAASDYKLSTFDIDDIDAGGVSSRANIGCNFESNRFYVFYPGFHDGYEQRIKVREMKLNSDGSMSKHGMTDLNEVKFPAACTMFDSKLFLVAQEHGSSTDGKMSYMTFDGKHWSKAHSMPEEVKTKCGVALVDLNNKLYCFYKYTDGSIRLVTSENGSHWTKSIEVKRAFLDPENGTIAACAYVDHEKTSRIMLSFPNKPRTRLYFQIVNPDGSTGKEIYHETTPYNVSMVQGSTRGGTKGNVIQAFYTKKEHIRLYKIEYSVDSEKLSSASYLDWGVGHEKIIGDDDSYVPGALTTFSGEDKNETRKYVVSFIARFYKDSDENYQRDLRLYAWESDIFKRDLNDTVAYDYDPHPSLCQMIGVIEGPPPYASNGSDYDDLISNKTFPPSYLEYGNSTTSKSENEEATSTNIDVKLSISRFGTGFSRETESTSSYETSKTVSNLLSLEPTQFNPIGYKIFMKPIIKRTKYNVYDWDNNLLFPIYTFKFSGPYIIYEPFDLSEFNENINPSDIHSYHNRSREFDKYDSISVFELKWYMGTTGYTEHYLESSKSIKNTTSQSIKVGVDEEFGEIFKIESEIEYTIDYSTTTTHSFERDLKVGFQFPGNSSNDNDIKYIHGYFYWIKPTDGMNNWWVPEEYKKDNPWLMTYNLDQVLTDIPRVVSVEEAINEQVFTIYPNPVKDELTLYINIDNQENSRIEITDLAGKKVKVFTLNQYSGKRELIWDLKDSNGNSLPSGAYFVRFQRNSYQITKKFSIIR